VVCKGESFEVNIKRDVILPIRIIYLLFEACISLHVGLSGNILSTELTVTGV
jgi:hypothetical protein